MKTVIRISLTKEQIELLILNRMIEWQEDDYKLPTVAIIREFAGRYYLEFEKD